MGEREGEIQIEKVPDWRVDGCVPFRVGELVQAFPVSLSSLSFGKLRFRAACLLKIVLEYT